MLCGSPRWSWLRWRPVTCGAGQWRCASRRRSCDRRSRRSASTSGTCASARSIVCVSSCRPRLRSGSGDLSPGVGRNGLPLPAGPALRSSSPSCRQRRRVRAPDDRSTPHVSGTRSAGARRPSRHPGRLRRLLPFRLRLSRLRPHRRRARHLHHLPGAEPARGGGGATGIAPISARVERIDGKREKGVAEATTAGAEARTAGEEARTAGAEASTAGAEESTATAAESVARGESRGTRAHLQDPLDPLEEDIEKVGYEPDPELSRVVMRGPVQA